MMLYTIEISVKTRELDHMITKKKQIRKKHAFLVAKYEHATG